MNRDAAGQGEFIPAFPFREALFRCIEEIAARVRSPYPPSSISHQARDDGRACARQALTLGFRVGVSRNQQWVNNFKIWGDGSVIIRGSLKK